MKKITILIGVCCITSFSFSQESISSSGDYHSNSTGSLSSTVGEISTETYSSSNAILTQGQQQHFYDFTSIEERSSSFNFSAYPNPVSDLMNIKIENFKEGDLLISMYSIEGKLMFQEKMNSDLHQIHLNKYSPSNYLITISDDSGQILHKFQLTKI